MNAEAKRRFKWLAALNMEGVASNQENLELWQLIRSRPGLRQEFIEVRHIHYLLTTLLDDAVSQKRFANRIVNALHPDRLSKPAFTDAVLNRLREEKPRKRKRVFRMAEWKIAASILIVIGCLAVFKQYVTQPSHRHGPVGREAAQYLDWNYQPAIPRLETKMAALYRHANSPTGWPPQRPSPVMHRVQQMNAQITRMEKRWPLSVDRPNDGKNGGP